MVAFVDKKENYSSFAGMLIWNLQKKIIN